MFIARSKSGVSSSADSNPPHDSRRGPAGVLIAGSVIAGIAALGWALDELLIRRRRTARHKDIDIVRWEGEGGAANEPKGAPGEL